MRAAFAVAFLGLAALGVLLAQKPFKEYPAIEYDGFSIPADSNQRTEWTRARLQYPDITGYPDAAPRYQNGQLFPGYWSMDYPRSDRHLLAGVRRLTRIDTRSVEQVVALDGTERQRQLASSTPAQLGMQLADENAKHLREYRCVADLDGLRLPRNSGMGRSSAESARLSRTGRSCVDIPNSDADFQYASRRDGAFDLGEEHFRVGQRREHDGFDPGAACTSIGTPTGSAPPSRTEVTHVFGPRSRIAEPRYPSRSGSLRVDVASLIGHWD